MTRDARLAIDAVGAIHGGAMRIALGAASAAERDSRVQEVLVFASRRAARRFDFPSGGRTRVVEVTADGGGMERIAWICSQVRRMCRNLRVSHALFLGGGGFVDRDVRATLLLQQSLPFVPEALSTLRAADRLRLEVIRGTIRWSADAADGIVVQTRTMERLVRAEIGCDAEKVSVVPVALLGDASLGKWKPREGRMPDALRLLYVGNASAYKNLGVLVTAANWLREAGMAIVVTATVEPGVLGLARSEVKEVGYLRDDKLILEYKKADCLVMPSLSETIGLPLVEAMAVGLPVVVADRPYAREVCEEAAVYFDPLSSEDLARAVIEATADGPERTRRVEEGFRRAAFWSSSSAYDELIRAVLEAR